MGRILARCVPFLRYKSVESFNPCSFRYALIISKISSPYLSTPFLPMYGMRNNISLSTGNRLLIPKMAFCCKMT